MRMGSLENLGRGGSTTGVFIEMKKEEGLLITTEFLTAEPNSYPS